MRLSSFFCKQPSNFDVLTKRIAARQYIKHCTGDLVKMAKEGHFHTIVHGCNCFCTMGAGIALQIARAFPEAVEADKKTKKGDRSKLGTYSGVVVEPRQFFPLRIINAYTQYHYDGDGTEDLVDYDALRSCMKNLKEHSSISGHIGMPRIGAGLACGNWERINQIIIEELHDVDVTIVHYNK